VEPVRVEIASAVMRVRQSCEERFEFVIPDRVDGRRAGRGGAQRRDRLVDQTGFLNGSATILTHTASQDDRPPLGMRTRPGRSGPVEPLVGIRVVFRPVVEVIGEMGGEGPAWRER